MAQRAIHLHVRGRVQGVGFRYFVVRAAEDSGVTGWVRNLDDGGVEARAEGTGDALGRFLAAVREGPRMALVEEVDVQDVEVSGTFHRFAVRF